jgi:hypothetical protein
MKKNILLFVSLLTLGTLSTSCSNDDNNSASIEGKWEQFQEGTIINGQEILVEIAETSACGKDYLELVQGGLLNDFSFGNSASDCTTPIETGIWTKNDNKLNIKYTSDAVRDYEILELTKTILKIKETDQDGVYILVFKRK